MATGNDLLDSVDAGVLDVDDAPNAGPGIGMPPGSDRRKRFVTDGNFGSVRARSAPGSKTLSEYWLKYAPEMDANFSVNISRIRSLANGQLVGGFLDSMIHQVTEPEVKSRYGGGRFKIEIFGSDPKTGVPGHKYEEVLVDIEGPPKMGADGGDDRSERDRSDRDRVERDRSERDRSDRDRSERDRDEPAWRKGLGSLADEFAPRRNVGFGFGQQRPAWSPRPTASGSGDGSGDTMKAVVEMLRDVVVAREQRSSSPTHVERPPEDILPKLKELLDMVQSGKGPEAHHVVQEMAVRHQAQVESLNAKHAAEMEEMRGRAGREVERVESRFTAMLEDARREKQDFESRLDRNTQDTRREFDRKVEDYQREIDRLRGAIEHTREEKIDDAKRLEDRHKAEIDRVRDDFKRELEATRRLQDDSLRLERDRSKDTVERISSQNEMYIETLKQSHDAMSTAERTGQQSVIKVLEGDIRGLEGENRHLRDSLAEAEKKVASAGDVTSQVKGLLSLKDALGALGLGRSESEAIIAAPTDEGAWGKVKGVLDSKFGEAAGAMIAQAAANILQQAANPQQPPKPQIPQQVQQQRPQVQQPQRPQVRRQEPQRPESPRPEPPRQAPPRPETQRPPPPKPDETDFLVQPHDAAPVVTFDLPPDGAPVIGVKNPAPVQEDPAAGITAFVRGIEGYMQAGIAPTAVADELKKHVPPNVLSELRDNPIESTVTQLLSFVPSDILGSAEGMAYMTQIQAALKT